MNPTIKKGNEKWWLRSIKEKFDKERWKKLDVEALKNVSGGARNTFDPERVQEYWNEKVEENDITKVPGLEDHHPKKMRDHSKKAKGKLYKKK